MSRLYISDLDGTLLDSYSRVSPLSAAIISRLSRKGVLISVATARTPATVEPLLAHTYTSIPAVVMTGAALWDRASQRFLDIRTHHPATVDAVCATLRSHGINPFYYAIESDSPVIDCYHFGQTLSDKEQKFISERNHLPLKRIHLQPGQLPPEGLSQHTALIFAIGNIADIQRTAACIARNIDCSLSCYPDIFNPRIGYLEIFAPGVDKASAVARLKERVNAESLTVFGDNLNDLPMMGIADTSVAVANALPQVLDRADIVIGPNSADSVANYISEQNR